MKTDCVKKLSMAIISLTLAVGMARKERECTATSCDHRRV